MTKSIDTLSMDPGTPSNGYYDVGPFKWTWFGGPHLEAFMSVKVGTTGYDFGNIIVEAMIRLGAAMADRTLYTAIADRIETHRIGGRQITPQGFAAADVDRIFKARDLRHSSYRIGSTGGDRWGEAQLGDNWLSLNAASITDTILTRFGQNAGRVADVTAGVIVHEMMHCGGFDHSLRPGDYIYECSLPEIAQDAFLQMRDPTGAYAPYGLVGRDGASVETRCGLHRD